MGFFFLPYHRAQAGPHWTYDGYVTTVADGTSKCYRGDNKVGAWMQVRTLSSS